MTVKKYDQLRKFGFYIFIASSVVVFVFMMALAYVAYLTMPFGLFILSAGFIAAIGMMLILLLSIIDELVIIRKLKEMEMKLR